MTRIYVPTLASPVTELPEKAQQHVRVLRLQVGDTLELFDGQGHIATACIRSIDKKNIQIDVQPLVVAPLPQTYPIHLMQALINPTKMDLIIQKAVELGVKSITPLICERTQGRPERVAQKMQHWQAIMESSAEQCGLNLLPVLHPIIALDSVPEAARTLGAHPVMLSPLAAKQSLGPRPAATAVIIGPEGGFSPRELAWATAQHLDALCLHENILRAETAAIVAIHYLQLDKLPFANDNESHLEIGE